MGVRHDLFSYRCTVSKLETSITCSASQIARSGAIQVLLSAVETHKADRDLGFTSYAVMSMATPDIVTGPAKELRGVTTAIAALRTNAYDQPYAQVSSLIVQCSSGTCIAVRYVCCSIIPS